MFQKKCNFDNSVEVMLFTDCSINIQQLPFQAVDSNGLVQPITLGEGNESYPMIEHLISFWIKAWQQVKQLQIQGPFHPKMWHWDKKAVSLCVIIFAKRHTVRNNRNKLWYNYNIHT